MNKKKRTNGNEALQIKMVKMTRRHHQRLVEFHTIHKCKNSKPFLLLQSQANVPSSNSDGDVIGNRKRPRNKMNTFDSDTDSDHDNDDDNHNDNGDDLPLNMVSIKIWSAHNFTNIENVFCFR